MKIIEVEYRELSSGPEFSNKTVGARATVEAGDSPDLVLDQLRGWVKRELQRGKTDVRAKVERTIAGIESELREMKEALRDDDIPF